MGIDHQVAVIVSTPRLTANISYYMVSTRIGWVAILFPFWLELELIELITRRHGRILLLVFLGAQT